MCHSSGMVGMDDHPKLVSGEVMVTVQKCFNMQSDNVLPSKEAEGNDGQVAAFCRARLCFTMNCMNESSQMHNKSISFKKLKKKKDPAMINRWGWCHRAKQRMRQSRLQEKQRVFDIISSGMFHWQLYLFNNQFTTNSDVWAFPFCIHGSLLRSDSSVSNMFRWGNTCKPEQHHMYSAAGTLYETLWQHDSVWPPKVQRKYLPRPDIFLLWEHWKYNQPLWLLRSLKISCKDNLDKVASCSILSVFGTSKLQCLHIHCIFCHILECEGVLF